MRNEEALSIIAPLGVGGTPCEGWVLSAAEPVDDVGSACFVFTHIAGDHPPFEVLARRRPVPEDVAVQTEQYSVSCRNSDSTPVRGETSEILELVSKSIRRNEQEKPARCGNWRRDVVLADGPALYLVPGHLGNPMDLSQRALFLLARVLVFFVETGHVEETKDLLESHGIASSAKTYVELTMSSTNNDALKRFRRMVEDRELGCLFGVGEGITGFCDVGSDLVAEAERLKVPIQSVGGPSSLCMTLMRLDRPVWEFKCLGRLESQRDLQRIRRSCLEETTLPVILLADGRACRELLPGVLAVRDWARGWIAAELTTADEKLIPLGDGTLGIPGRVDLPDPSRVVVVLEPLDGVGWRRKLRVRLGRLVGR